MTDKGSKLRFIRSEFKWETVDFLCTQMGSTVYFTIDENRRARVDLSIYAGGGITADHYTGFRVKIIDKNGGEIERLDFTWRDFLDCKNPADRPAVVGHVGWEWYNTSHNHRGNGIVLNAPPVSTQPIVDAINEWITLFK